MQTGPEIVQELRGGRVAQEVADAEFLRFLEAMDLGGGLADMDEDDRSSFDMQKARIIRAIMRGSVVIDDKGQPVFTQMKPPVTDTGSAITFYEPTGGSYAAIRDGKNPVKESIVFMAHSTKQPPTRFDAMSNRDFKVCNAISAIFIAAQ